MKSSPAKNFIVVFSALAAAGLLLVSAAVSIVDPFFRYHDPIAGFPYVIDNQLSQNIGMAERFSYDAVITGSSMTMNFDTKDFTALMSVHPLKLTVNGALPRDIARMLESAYAGGNDIRQVVIAIDPATWTAGSGDVKYPYPEYLYDRNPFNDVKYLWNMEVLLDYCLRPIAEREPTDLTTLWSTEWEEDMYYTLDWILAHYEEPAAIEEKTPEDAYLADTARSLSENLLPFVDAHPETTFFFFFPPYSVLYWHNAVRENHLEATFAQETLLAETLLARRNARVFMYQDLEDIITDIDGGYMDEIHFRPAINAYMVRTMAEGEQEVADSDMMRARLERLYAIIENYDFDAVLPPQR